GGGAETPRRHGAAAAGRAEDSEEEAMLLEDAGALTEPRRIDRPQPKLPDRNLERLLRRRWRDGKRDRSREQERQPPALIAHGPSQPLSWPRARTRPLCLLLISCAAGFG